MCNTVRVENDINANISYIVISILTISLIYILILSVKQHFTVFNEHTPLNLNNLIDVCK